MVWHYSLSLSLSPARPPPLYVRVFMFTRGAAPGVGRGDDTVGNPHRAQNFSIRTFRAYPLVEIRQTVPCRAIRGDSISVNSTPPP